MDAQRHRRRPVGRWRAHRHRHLRSRSDRGTDQHSLAGNRTSSPVATSPSSSSPPARAW
jgi:hypothetical protein